MAISITAHIDDAQFRRDIARLQAAMQSGDEPNLRGALKQGAARYLAFIRRRYLAAARGDGTWPALALSTKLARLRKNKKVYAKFKKLKAEKGQMAAVAAMKFEILRDTGLLFNSLTTGNPGAVETNVPQGIDVGTAIEYAHYHQFGGSIPGRPPMRKILVDPDDATLEAMGRDLERGVDRAIRAMFPGG